ncbi:MAG: hypothetical protein CMP65_04245 [Flavobacteriales bacterium]|nr:hypothetical protein [Flavobacteriales bacterium]
MKNAFLIQFYKQASIAIVLLFVFGCSTQKDAAFNRFYHKMNTKYNGLFYAEYHLEQGIQRLNDSHSDNYDKIISINRLGELLDAKNTQSSFDKAIEKSQLVIKKHSMDIGGEEKNTLIEKAYLVMAKAQFYKKDYFVAKNTFGFLVKKSLKESTQSEAALWLARCHQELGNKEALRQQIRKLKDDFYLSLSQESRLFEIEAELSLDEGDLEDARINILKAIDSSKNKHKQARMHFILGQILLEQKSDNSAVKQFEKVIKKNPNYELVFNSKLNKTKATNLNSKSFEKIKEELTKMLNDKKNNEYKDQIFYALANLDLTQKDTTSAITNLRTSATLALFNASQKIKSHQKLASIFWDKKQYIETFVHIDSVFQLIDATHVDFFKTKVMHKNTKSIADYYLKINYNDSLIKLAQSPEEVRNQIIDEHIERLRAQDEEMKQQAQNNRPGSNFNSYEFNRQAQNSMNVTAGGGWYFYNPSAISLGYSEFISRWGNRKLEDNWRRKNKNQVNQEEEFSFGEKSEPSQKEKYERSYYISQLPMEESQQLQLLSQTETAHYNLGVLFKNDVIDYTQSISIFQKLLQRFPNTSYKQATYFDLYNLYNILNDSIQSNIFFNKINSEFPNSPYLAVLNGSQADIASLEKDESIYAKIHELYSTFSETSCNEMGQIISQHPNNVYIAQMELLNIFCKARDLNKKQFIMALEELQTKFQNSQISVELNNILSELKGEGALVMKTRYTNDFQSPHVFFILLKDLSINLPTTQSSLSKFNSTNYSLAELEITNLLLDKKNQLIQVAKFKNKDEALVYYQQITETADLKEMFDSGIALPLVISENNYAQLLRHKDIQEYIDYFNEIYLLI